MLIAEYNNIKNNVIIVEEQTNNLIKEENLLKVFPNPTSNLLYVISNKEVISFELYNHYGNMVQKEIKNKTKEFDIPMNSLSKGIYYLKIICQNGAVLTKTVTKK